MKLENTEWHKYFNLDEEGNPLLDKDGKPNEIAWKFTAKNGVVAKSINWKDDYDKGNDSVSFGQAQSRQTNRQI